MLSDKVQQLHSELDEEQAQAVNVTQFIALVRKYTNMQELTPTIVNEFISRIIIHAPDKSSGHRVQKIDIKYNFVGMLPTVLPNSRTA